MKKYFYFLILFGFFFPLTHKIALAILMLLFKNDPIVLLSYYHEYGLLSMRNLLISAVAGTATFFFTNMFAKWESEKNQK